MQINVLTYKSGSPAGVQKSVLATLATLHNNNRISEPVVVTRLVRSFLVKPEHLREVERHLQRKHIPYRKGTTS